MTRRCLGTPDRPFAYCHYENISVISTKPGLIRTLGDYYSRTPMFKQVGYTLQHSMAMSFIIPAGSDAFAGRELGELKKLFKRIAKRDMAQESLPARQLEKNFWIMKPENENRGRGIELATTLQDILLHVHKKPSTEGVVVQKYIERPLLYQGRKFDIRVLALIDGERNLWRYRPCYLRTSSDPYTLQDNSKYIHLTNNCFQCNSDKYQQYEPGNQLPYDDFLAYLDTHCQVRDLDKNHLTQRMKDLMIDCHVAAFPILDPRKRPGLKFELIGFDFILDEDFRVWLIEVNTCPYLGPVLPTEQPSFMLDLMDDTLKLTVDRHFFPDQATAEDLEKKTQYELIWSADGKINKRTELTVESASVRDTKEGDLTKSNLKSNQQLGWFPQCLYPSKEVHAELLRAQANAHDRWVRQKADEQLMLQKAMKARAAKLAGGQSSYGLIAAYGAPNPQASQSVEGRNFTQKKPTDLKQGASRILERGGSISKPKKTLPAAINSMSKGAATAKANGSGQASAPLQAGNESKRTRSAIRSFEKKEKENENVVDDYNADGDGNNQGASGNGQEANLNDISMNSKRKAGKSQVPPTFGTPPSIVD